MIFALTGLCMQFLLRNLGCVCYKPDAQRSGRGTNVGRIAQTRLLLMWECTYKQVRPCVCMYVFAEPLHAYVSMCACVCNRMHSSVPVYVPMCGCLHARVGERGG
jgi:hypothetical protein